MILAIQPLHNVKAVRAVQRDGVVVEKIGHHDEVPVGSELVGDELSIVEFVADDIGDAGGKKEVC